MNPLFSVARCEVNGIAEDVQMLCSERNLSIHVDASFDEQLNDRRLIGNGGQTQRTLTTIKQRQAANIKLDQSSYGMNYSSG